MSLSLMAGASASLLPKRAQAATDITVLNWQGYGTDEAWSLKKFAETTGINVIHDYYSSESEALTKLHTNPGQYDLVVFSASRALQAISEGLLQPVDFSKVPNAAGVDKSVAENPNFNVDGKGYAVPWNWGLTSIAYREGIPEPVSYMALADKQFENRLCLMDDGITGVAMAALMTGQDINNPKDLGAIKDVLKSLKPNVKLLWSTEDQWNKAFAAKEFDISMFWSGSLVRSKRNLKLPVNFTVPKEGGMGWLAGLCIPSSSTKAVEALAFANWLMDPAFYVEWATKVGAPASVSQTIMDALPGDDLSRQFHKPEYLKSMAVMSALPDERLQAFTDLWLEIKAYYAS
jgi:spermidine/putrescine transport system substrate-binding protein